MAGAIQVDRAAAKRWSNSPEAKASAERIREKLRAEGLLPTTEEMEEIYAWEPKINGTPEPKD